MTASGIPGSKSPPQDTVLVVEDEVLVRHVIAQYLRDCGYKVIEASNADDAIVVLPQAELIVDVVFTDIEMPGTMDGFALAQWVRKSKPGIHVVLAGTVARAAQAAGDLCESGPTLGKPYEPSAVSEHIRRLLAQANRNKAMEP